MGTTLWFIGTTFIGWLSGYLYAIGEPDQLMTGLVGAAIGFVVGLVLWLMAHGFADGAEGLADAFDGFGFDGD